MTIVFCAIGIFGMNGGGTIQIFLLLLIVVTGVKLLTAQIHF
jgi:hypothetical protein